MAHVIVVTIASNKQAFITPLHTHYFGNTTAVGHGILTSVTKPWKCVEASWHNQAEIDVEAESDTGPCING